MLYNTKEKVGEIQMELTQEDLDEAVRAFTADPNVYAAAAEEAFRKSALLAAREIVNIGLHAESDKVRLDACKYVTDRVLGKIRDKEAAATGKEPWDDIMSAVVREPTAEERHRGAKPR